MSSYAFYPKEKLYRAVRPIEMFVKENGGITSAAFTDSDKESGLSVDKQNNRTNETSINFISDKREGWIVSVKVKHCDEKNIEYCHVPIEDNPYHSELSKDRDNKKFTLTKGQARYLAKNCVIELKKS